MGCYRWNKGAYCCDWLLTVLLVLVLLMLALLPLLCRLG